MRSPITNLLAAMALFMSAFGMAPALAGVETIAPPKESIQTIGQVPPKRFIRLDLGEIRTKNARLPGGTRSLKDRMKLRNKRALARQRAVTKARRSPAKSAAKNSGKGGPPSDEPDNPISIE